MSYRLSLDVDETALTYTGQVAVRLDHPTPELKLNSLGLQIDGAEADGKPVPHHEDTPNEELRVGPLPPGCHEVHVRFQGRVAPDALAGFYRSRHGAGGHLLTTHLAPTAARRLFPCVDHPAEKAVYQVEVTCDAGSEVVFNTDPLEVRTTGTRKTWTFRPTPKMSTYLIYLGIGKFDTVEEQRNGLRVLVRAPPGLKGSCAWGLDNAHRSVEAFATYYGIPYPLPKLDLISVHDFAAGAMENWGAISFRESYLLVDEHTTNFLKQVVAEVVAHEVAHQWFGNLVTMEWWNDIWLNESFATFMSYKMVDRFYPDWEIFGQFLISQTGGALTDDSLESTHPIDVPVRRPEDVNEIFDNISYGKGGSVLRMIEAFVGEEAFRQGVGDYLRAHAYGNARGEALWKSLESSSHQPIVHIIDPWIHRSGHPIVLVRRDGGLLRLEQKRFRLNGQHAEETWPIPMALRDGTEERRELFEGRSRVLPAPKSEDFSLNARSAGFYRVLYDEASYEKLRRTFDALPSTERWSLLRDLTSFLYSGDVSPALFQGFLDRLTSETDPAVVTEAASRVLDFYLLLGPDHALIATGRKFLAAQTRRLGLSRTPGESDSVGVARERVVTARAIMDPGFAQELAPRFRTWEKLDPDLRGGAAVAYVRIEGASALEPLVARLKAAKTEGEVEPLLMGLVFFHDPQLVAKGLSWATDGGVSRSLLSTLGTLAATNPDGREVCWEWFRKNQELLERTYAGTAMLTLMIERMVPHVGIGRAAEIRQALQDRPVAESERGARKGLELLEVRERFAARVAPPPSAPAR